MQYWNSSGPSIEAEKLKTSECRKSQQNTQELGYLNWNDNAEKNFDVWEEAKGFCTGGDWTRDLSPTQGVGACRNEPKTWGKWAVVAARRMRENYTGEWGFPGALCARVNESKSWVILLWGFTIRRYCQKMGPEYSFSKELLILARWISPKTSMKAWYRPVLWCQGDNCIGQRSCVAPAWSQHVGRTWNKK